MEHHVEEGAHLFTFTISSATVEKVCVVGGCKVQTPGHGYDVTGSWSMFYRAAYKSHRGVSASGPEQPTQST